MQLLWCVWEEMFLICSVKLIKKTFKLYMVTNYTVWLTGNPGYQFEWPEHSDGSKRPQVKLRSRRRQNTASKKQDLGQVIYLYLIMSPLFDQVPPEKKLLIYNVDLEAEAAITCEAVIDCWCLSCKSQRALVKCFHWLIEIYQPHLAEHVFITTHSQHTHIHPSTITHFSV